VVWAAFREGPICLVMSMPTQCDTPAGGRWKRVLPTLRPEPAVAGANPRPATAPKNRTEVPVMTIFDPELPSWPEEVPQSVDRAWPTRTVSARVSAGIARAFPARQAPVRLSLADVLIADQARRAECAASGFLASLPAYVCSDATWS
jgi:hypothetical protein